MTSIATITLNPVIDLIYTVPSFKAGETKRADDFRMMPAGKGINVSYTLSCLGTGSSTYLVLGERDVHVYEQACHERNITMHGFVSAVETRKHCTILDPDGDGITHVQTRGEPLPPSLIEELLSNLTRQLRMDDIVVLAGSLPLGIPDTIFGTFISKCKERGALTFLDSSGPALLHGAIAHPYLVKVNQSEAEEITGITVKSAQDEYDLLYRIHQLSDVPVVVITFGKHGIIAGCDEGVWRMSVPMHSAEMKDTVGCGDALMAGLVQGHAQRMPREDQFRYALACASDAACQVGPGIVDPARVEEFKPRVESELLGTL